MTERTDAIRSLSDLRGFVHGLLCEKENLVPEQFQMKEMSLVVRGRQCGMQFCLKGPRSVRLGAIWAADKNMLYFYDTRGERYMKLRLRQRVFVDAPAA
ncbi:MAG: hypothetical protein DWQ34_28375 [Planctomycetota bacterium]|nr:MAG: hypothetical protein DWQ34_28375 [Planctomycetota bacterium]REJ87405.1 MAG: hypothetical protein DWQ29_09390 [Planctomycetota bacterium]REK32972.1 MAG: hypothetical protein DWQ45_15305 [Planctomycetota bacterium]